MIEFRVYPVVNSTGKPGRFFLRTCSRSRDHCHWQYDIGEEEINAVRVIEETQSAGEIASWQNFVTQVLQGGGCILSDCVIIFYEQYGFFSRSTRYRSAVT
jgi:hypothetical protein